MENYNTFHHVYKICIENTSFSENFNNIAVGSAPGVKTKTNGVKQLESLKIVDKSNGRGTVNL